MLFKLTKFKIIAALAVIAVLGYFGYRWYAARTPAGVKYTVAAVTREALSISVSGTGQIAAKQQIDVKSEVAGTVTGAYAVKDKAVKAGDILFALDSRDAQKSIRDAQVALDDAQAKLDDMLAPPSEQDLLQAESAVTQAERNLEQAANDRLDAETDGEKAIQNAYEDAYDASSTQLFKLSDYLSDLKDVLGTSTSSEDNLRSYELILGSGSPLVAAVRDDYYAARDSYDAASSYFTGVDRSGSRDQIYSLIGKMVNATDAVTKALESARRMFDAIVIHDYSSLKISSTINTMQPKIESDVSAAYGSLSTLSDKRDAIDSAVKNKPKAIADADWSVKTATDSLTTKRLALDDLKAGATDQEIRSQRNSVAQRQDALVAARENLAKYTVRASIDGILASVNNDAVKGKDISSGTVLATIITEQKIATITLNEIDIAKVQLAQKATITFDAIEDLTMTGTVTEIDTLGTTSQGVVSYDVQVALDIQDERVKPGMSVSVTIVVDRKPDVLVVPNSAVKTSNGAHYVEVLPGVTAAGTVTSTATPERRSVETGLANDTSTEILSGLSEGDLIVTRTTTAASASSTTGTSGSSNNRTGGNAGFRMIGGPGF